jgi:Uma2 family endonuclease
MALRVPQYTTRDLDLLPDDGNRYELLGGMLLVTPGPGSAHQGVAATLSALFADHLLHGRLRLFSPGTVRRPPLTHLEPDVLVMPPDFVPGTAWEEATAYWLAVEVLSRSSRVYDREFKRDAYLALGVREVWLVDIANRCVETSDRPGAGRIEHDVLEWTAPDGAPSVRVELGVLFADLK